MAIQQNWSSNKKVTTFQKLKKLHFWLKVQIWKNFILLHKGSIAKGIFIPKDLKLDEITTLDLSKIEKLPFLAKF